VKAVASAALKHAEDHGWFEDGNTTVTGAVGGAGAQLLQNVLLKCSAGMGVDLGDVHTLEDLGIRRMELSVPLSACMQTLIDQAAASMLTTMTVQTLTTMSESLLRLHVDNGLLARGTLLRGRLLFNPHQVEQFLRSVYTGVRLPAGELGLLCAEKIGAEAACSVLGLDSNPNGVFGFLVKEGTLPALRYLQVGKSVMLSCDVERLRALLDNPDATTPDSNQGMQDALAVTRIGQVRLPF
jgi:hypothetical protein